MCLDVKDFYLNMYVPYIKKIHGDRAILMQYEAMIEKMSETELLLTKSDDGYIGANP